MGKATNLNIRVSGSLSEFVASNVGDAGDYDNVSEYIRDLIRQDKKRAEQAEFERTKAELKLAFSAPDSDYREFSASDVIGRRSGFHEE
ncbi:addiction module antitoxin [Alphaproteobacteria bacterium]|jgi:antitoxin ParD1/3/4|nr:addiction module antitoxin [Alphaproteobacteria bacterium]